jgi:aliphatic nitrilase
VVRAAAVQAASPFLDRTAGVDRVIESLEACADEKVQLAVFPESFVPGHPLWLHFWPVNDRRSVDAYQLLFEQAVEVPGPDVDRLCSAAARTGVDAVVGITEKRPGSTGTLYNTQLFISREGRLVGKHQKLVPTVREKIVHAPGGGDTFDTFPMSTARIGGLICGENSNPLAVYGLQALDETIHAASWPPFMGFKPVAPVVGFVSQSLAYSGHVHVVNAVGLVDDSFFEFMGGDPAPEDLVPVTGGSSIVDPFGRFVAGPLPLGEPGMAVADLHLESAVRAKLSHDFTGHYNRFDVFELHLKRSPQRSIVIDDPAPGTDAPPMGGEER